LILHGTSLGVNFKAVAIGRPKLQNNSGIITFAARFWIMAFTKVATTEEIPSGQAKKIRLGNKDVALFNINGTFYAIDDSCPHRGGPLSEGELEGLEVTCPWHGAAFNITTGEHLCPPANSDVIAYKVQVTGNDVMIEV
jgi:nitrite reductase/ring-hydroxylating ferredoxin subunit